MSNPIPVTIVCGPPGSGKTTYVEKHKSWGDLVIDVDALFVALSGGLGWYEHPVALLPFVMEARDAVIARLARTHEVSKAWILTAEGDMNKVRALAKRIGGAEILPIEVGAAECLRRISLDDRRTADGDKWSELVNKWWQSYETTR